MKKIISPDFDPNGLGLDNGHIFGLPFQEKESELLILEVPRDITVSYREGTSLGPASILEASRQIELYDPFFPECWEYGIHYLKANQELYKLNKQSRQEALSIIQALEKGESIESQTNSLQKINQACIAWDKEIEITCKKHLSKNKLIAVLGGDHSSPLGLIKALAEKYDSFGILQIDAHMDLREAYEGFERSHASIMFNALKLSNISRVVQVGIRDYCEAELDFSDQYKDRISTFFQRDIEQLAFRGINWSSQVTRMLDHLPQKVYISFDIDGLDPSLCPDTGTPVPGGLSMAQATHLIEAIVNSGREIIGFDLCEVAPGQNEWNTIVGARLLYRLCACALKSKLNSKTS